MNKTQARKFDDESYILHYQKFGCFPKIHQDIATIIREYASEAEPCMDIGACTSLLSVQAVEIGRSICVAVEANPSYIAKAVKHPLVVQERLRIKPSTLHLFERLLVAYRPTLLIARRVFSELESPDFVSMMAEVLSRNQVEKIVLEGRTKTKAATNALPDADAEVQALAPHYVVKYAYNDVRLLCRTT